MYKHQVLFYALHRPGKAVEIWQLNSSYRWVELRFIYPQDGSHSYHISRLMDWEMKTERLDGSPGNVGAGMLRKDNNPWGARKEFRPGPRKAGRGDSASLRRRASWTHIVAVCNSRRWVHFYVYGAMRGWNTGVYLYRNHKWDGSNYNKKIAVDNKIVIHSLCIYRSYG